MRAGHSSFGSLNRSQGDPMQVADMSPVVRWRAEKETEEFILCTSRGIQLYASDTGSVELDAEFTLHDTTKKATCFDWCSLGTEENVCFLGLSSGELLMLNRHQADPDHLDHHAQQPLAPFCFLSRNTACVCLSASRTQPVIAAGYRKSASEKSVVCLDISAANPNVPPKRYETFLKKSEVATCIDFRDLARTLVVSTQNRNIHIIDRRSGSAAVRSWTARGEGVEPLQVSFAPQNDLLASYSADSSNVLIWDLRRIWKNRNRHDLQAIVHSSHTREFHWTESSDANERCSFWTLHGDLPTLSSWEAASTRVEQPMQINSSLYSRNFGVPVLSAHPHPGISGLWVTVNAQNDVRLFDLKTKNAVRFSSVGEIAVACGDSLLFTTKDTEDSIDTMRRRLRQGYGFDVCKNIELLAEENNYLRHTWAWLKVVFRIQKPTDRLQNIRAAWATLTKVREVIKLGLLNLLEGLRSDVQEVYMLDIEVTCYTTEIRTFILNICGWSLDPMKVEQSTEELKKSGRFAQAAALHLFQYDETKINVDYTVQECVSLLIEGAGHQSLSETERTELQLVAMTVSGCGPNRNPIQREWKRAANQTVQRLTCPYLRAIIHFVLNCDNGNFNEILGDEEIPLKDRVAFAARFLIDSEYVAFIDGLTQTILEQGDLQGVLIVGMEKLGETLFDTFLERTNDIQTIALICSYLSSVWGHGVPESVEQLISIYRDVLNRWECFTERCLFDTERQDLASQKMKSVPSIVGCCLACGASLMTERTHSARRINHRSRQGLGFACTTCKAMFPRCSLCLKTFYTSSDPAHKKVNFGKSKDDGRGAASWFTWCQKCHHGGHFACITEWFEQSKECAVAGCDCECFESEYTEFRRLTSIRLANPNHSPLLPPGFHMSPLGSPI